ncbi:MAG TPA: hypothetical protein VES42_01460 [Pilimelia sp.]|nr:hypothetical protein [Pilimelia sp.]
MRGGRYAGPSSPWDPDFVAGHLPPDDPQPSTVAGVGVVLLLAGAASHLVARRRRTRFEV